MSRLEVRDLAIGFDEGKDVLGRLITRMRLGLERALTHSAQGTGPQAEAGPPVSPSRPSAEPPATRTPGTS